MTKRPFKKGFSKYNAKKITIDGHVFDSVAESTRYRELKLLEKSGYITELELQPCFILQDKYIAPKVNGKKESVRAIKYKADFKYKDISGDIVVEDVKGFKTDVYQLKKKLFLYKYGDLYDFREI